MLQIIYKSSHHTVLWWWFNYTTLWIESLPHGLFRQHLSYTCVHFYILIFYLPTWFCFANGNTTKNTFIHVAYNNNH